MYKWHKKAVSYPSLVPFRFVASHVPFRLGQRGLQLNAASWIVRVCVRFCCMLYMQHCSATCYRQARLTFVAVACSEQQAAAGSLLQQSWSYHFLALFMFDFVNLFYLLHYLSMQLSIPTRYYYSFPWHFPTAFANRPRPLTVLPRPTVCLSVFLSSLAWPCFIFHLNNL